MKKFMATITSTLIALSSSGSAIAGYDCRSSISDYKSAISEISSTLGRYTSCVEYSRGKDDCSTEFRRLKYAQDSFESAVSDISSNCEN